MPDESNLDQQAMGRVRQALIVYRLAMIGMLVSGCASRRNDQSLRPTASSSGGANTAASAPKSSTLSDVEVARTSLTELGGGHTNVMFLSSLTNLPNAVQIKVGPIAEAG